MYQNMFSANAMAKQQHVHGMLALKMISCKHRHVLIWNSCNWNQDDAKDDESDQDDEEGDQNDEEEEEEDNDKNDDDELPYLPEPYSKHVISYYFLFCCIMFSYCNL